MGSLWHPGVNPAADIVVFGPQRERVLLIVRDGSTAEAARLALPGGFVDTDAAKGQPWQEGRETPRQAAVRELEEETTLRVDPCDLIELTAREGGGRDPRDTDTAWVRSSPFAVVLMECPPVQAADGVDEVTWMQVDRALEAGLAFDHADILREALLTTR